MKHRKFLRKLLFKTIDNVDDLHNTKWLSELIKGIVLSLLMFFLSAIVLYFIRVLSPGSYNGEKLANYLDDILIKTIDAEQIESQILFNGNYDLLIDEKIIIVYSKYALDKDDAYLSGRSISVFERKESTILNDFFGTIPKYDIVFCGACKAGYGVLEYSSFYYDDLDGNGRIEFALETISRYADRVSHERILLEKDEDNWEIVSPDLTKIKRKIAEVLEKDIMFGSDTPTGFINDSDSVDMSIDVEVYKFRDKVEGEATYNVIGIWNEGEGYSLSNPLNGAFEMCYRFSCRNLNSYETSYIYVMLQYNNNKLFIDPNWNGGKPLFTSEALDFEYEYNDYWGIQIGGHIFYVEPGEEGD